RLAPSVLGAICVTAIVAMGIARERVFDVGNAGLRATGLPNTELFRMIYSSFLRPDALFVGCLLAIALHVTRRLDRLTSWFRVIGPAGLAVAVGTLVLVPRQGSWSFGALQPPWALTIFNLATGVVICWLVLVPTSPFARVLSVRPLIWIGRRSYGIYVVHMFVIHAFTAIVFRHRLSTVQTVRPIVVPLLSVGIAGASYRWIESPFLRVKERFAAR
ncbi:MAG: acyltransferase, partial [Actinobacteria bacterium]|nr:acyltransferase [Actinomycetota bacterium]